MNTAKVKKLQNNTPTTVATSKTHRSFFEMLGLGSVEKLLQKIPFLGNAIVFLLINLIVATVFYYLCYVLLWLMSAAPEEEGQWFVRRVDILGKSFTRLTTYAAEHIAYFVAGFAAFLFTYDNYNATDKRRFIAKLALVSLIPVCFLLITKVFTKMPVYISEAFIYGQFAAIVIICLVKLFGSDKTAKNA
jgi:hypothetical protein